MPIDIALARKIARDFGLSLSDAQALSLVAVSEDDARAIAEEFRLHRDQKPDSIESIVDQIPREF